MNHTLHVSDGQPNATHTCASDDAEKLLGIAEALFRQEQNFLLAEHVLQKCADIFGAAAALPNASDMTKKREEVMEFPLATCHAKKSKSFVGTAMR
jgi:hypothetical protein